MTDYCITCERTTDFVYDDTDELRCTRCGCPTVEEDDDDYDEDEDEDRHDAFLEALDNTDGGRANAAFS
ncbi:hypothetical protein SAMN05421776_12148 [Nocardia farcinica]|uniref:Uncharacterized protein n=1 Tax=Nocardia farcinica TaxID=37329 RepID=A0A0H5P945_NOCFR|nr:hypothetical protein [Nocardia farcinica]AXK88554.1 hypothetical protein DXT66_25685 [Nocardia farcinica]PFW98857.1 hypothetical protein CJ469_05818 [Nocardia farcinica]PFX04463.1 hypothetical protein CJ468_05439 [Nocardia farcinica]CRY84227.1 Uncharacterised protein [Nocardia farcinica]SIT34108.1 hypothetical protein SAMN05421776_12148 [Nocardia farcinica]